MRDLRWLHGHPLKAKFRPEAAANKAAVEMTEQSLQGRPQVQTNGWVTWLDNNQLSAQYGQWIAYNVATGKTFVQVLPTEKKQA